MKTSTAKSAAVESLPPKPPAPPSIRPVTDAVATEGAKFGALARHWWGQGADGCQEAMASVQHEAKVLNERAQDYVRDEPLKSVLVAAAAGAAITGLVMLMVRQR